jgi:serine/threonine-protein phosphatase 2B catalytic subunit
LRSEPNLLLIPADSLVIFGDIHGQFTDLAAMTRQVGLPGPGTKQKRTYLLLGDYVDRGVFGIECVLFLFAMKIKTPNSVFMLRGNHESRSMTEEYTFRAEVLAQFGLDVYELFMECFDCLPLAARVGKRYLCVHGGLSPQLAKMDEINKLDRFQEIPAEGLFADLIWSDPSEEGVGNFYENEERGCSYYFGKEPTLNFLQNNDIDTLFRAHQVKEKGYELCKWRGFHELPAVITVFSAPNYCGSYANKAAVILIPQKGNMEIKQFGSAPNQPFLLADGMNVFEWTLPYLFEKVMHMWHYMLTRCSNREVSHEVDVKSILETQAGIQQKEKLEKALALFKKVNTV